MNSIIVGFSILMIIFVWRYVWQPTLLDTTRDKLFDLRDGARQWFIDNGYPLDTKAYVALRDILNCHLRNTEDLSMTQFIAYSIAKSAQKNRADKSLEEKIENAFRTSDKKIERYVMTVRSHAAFLLLWHIVQKSIFTLLCFFIFSVFSCLKKNLFFILAFLMKSSTRGVMQHDNILSKVLSLLFPGSPKNIYMEKFSIQKRRSDFCRT